MQTENKRRLHLYSFPKLDPSLEYLMAVCTAIPRFVCQKRHDTQRPVFRISTYLEIDVRNCYFCYFSSLYVQI
jgi:hypothetical protein